MRKQIFIFFCLVLCQAFGNSPLMVPPQGEGNLTIHNAILAKVNGNTISVLDVMKKMDLLFHKSYPQLLDSKTARYQFYQSAWQSVLNEMIHTELILADSQAKELKVTDGEVREEMENRFGPKLMLTLDRIGLSFQEAWKLVKNEMMVDRMNWYFVNSKAIQKVTPQLIKDAYAAYCVENPAKEEWNYQVVTVRSEDKDKGEALAKKIHEHLMQAKSEEASSWQETLKQLPSEENCSFQISPEYHTEAKHLSEAHLEVLKTLQDNEFSKPFTQNSRFDKKTLYRIFHLKHHEKAAPPSFEEMSSKLRDKLLQQVAMEESRAYIEKLQKQYSHGQDLKEKLSADFTPFVIQ